MKKSPVLMFCFELEIDSRDVLWEVKLLHFTAKMRNFIAFCNKSDLNNPILMGTSHLRSNIKRGYKHVTSNTLYSRDFDQRKRM